jgi:hypothetical protein
MFVIEGPGIGPEDFERISREMRDWKAAQHKVVEEATRIVLEHQAELARHGLLPEPRPRP